MLYNLASGENQLPPRWASYKVPGGSRVTSYTISSLQPDSFYKIRVIAVSMVGIDGQPATISSSPRIISRPPSGPPKNVSSWKTGAHWDISLNVGAETVLPIFLKF